MAERLVKSVKLAIMNSCPPRSRDDIRFVGPSRRRESNMLSVMSGGSLDINAMSQALKRFGCRVVLRTTGEDGNRIDVYIPRSTGFVARTLLKASTLTCLAVTLYLYGKDCFS